MVRVKDVIDLMEELAPAHWAEEWDRVGLQVGRADAQAQRILVAVDCTPQVAQEALRLGVDLIITHHPLIFKPLTELRWDKPSGLVLSTLVQGEVSLFVSHTNLDRAPEGMGHWLAQMLGIEGGSPLVPFTNPEYEKLVVFVPQAGVEPVREAITTAGAGTIGRYSHCTFTTSGEGTFLPGQGTSPTIGQQGVLERVAEWRLETILPKRLREAVVRAMLQAHPYEEVAYDLYPLELSRAGVGYGRVGQLPQPVPLGALAQHVKDVLGLSWVRMSGDRERLIQRIAVLGGSGGEYIRQAAAAGVDLYLTGELDYHDALLGRDLGLSLMETGHGMSERVAVSEVQRYLKERLPVEVLASQCWQDVYQIC